MTLFHSSPSEPDGMFGGPPASCSGGYFSNGFPGVTLHALSVSETELDDACSQHSYDPGDLPQIDAWQRYESPPAYERRSRARMRKSGIAEWVSRSHNPRPVEGVSEIDLVVKGLRYLIFLEAKLESDISTATTYDPSRNQIIRNVDVLLENCGAREPAFWMVVKDKGPGRAYRQLIHRYRDDPQTLASALPHRDPTIVVRVARNLAIIQWHDLLGCIRQGPADVMTELRHRVH